ncbi:MAG: RusA family crossover junction endodeoxyribonuclease, partial [Streptosporangiaceae bacterium]|nr:RusA family crossover junction endodeoxyribonuclease [Streptosporangiaceae bacterium]
MTAPEISLPPGADPPVGGDSTPALPWADSHGNTAGRAPIVVARFTVDGEPVSKARPRFATKGSKNQTYTPQKTRDAEQVVAWKFRATAPGHKPNSEHTYGVTALFVSGTRHRRDVDNMLKLIL